MKRTAASLIAGLLILAGCGGGGTSTMPGLMVATSVAPLSDLDRCGLISDAYGAALLGRFDNITVEMASYSQADKDAFAKEVTDFVLVAQAQAGEMTDNPAAVAMLDIVKTGPVVAVTAKESTLTMMATALNPFLDAVTATFKRCGVIRDSAAELATRSN